jgi:hypothetical protein
LGKLCVVTCVPNFIVGHGEEQCDVCYVKADTEQGEEGVVVVDRHVSLRGLFLWLLVTAHFFG